MKPSAGVTAPRKDFGRRGIQGWVREQIKECSSGRVALNGIARCGTFPRAWTSTVVASGGEMKQNPKAKRATAGIRDQIVCN